MRLVTFKRVYDQVLRRVGLDPADAGFSAVRQEFVADAISMRCKEGWEWDFWPELSVVEERTPVSGLVAYEQSGQTQLGEVMGIWTANPETSPMTARSYAVVMTASGAQIMDTAVGATVFVKFRRRPSRFTRVAFDGAASYADGDLMYYATTGECYQAQSSEWVMMPFPDLLEQFVVWTAAADYLRDTSQHEKADEHEGRGYELLEKQHQKTFAQQQMFRGAAVRVE